MVCRKRKLGVDAWSSVEMREATSFWCRLRTIVSCESEMCHLVVRNRSSLRGGTQRRSLFGEKIFVPVLEAKRFDLVERKLNHSRQTLLSHEEKQTSQIG